MNKSDVRYLYMKYIHLLVFGALMGSSQVQAALVMTIDTVTKELWLTGTATGVTSSSGRAVWSAGNSSSGDIAGANKSVVTTSPLLNISSIRISHPTGGIGSTFAIWFNQINTSTTITGAGSAQKVWYGGMGSASITQFETGIGKTLFNTESGSTSFGSITVVPEPSSASLLIAGAVGLVALRQRRKS